MEQTLLLKNATDGESFGSVLVMNYWRLFVLACCVLSVRAEVVINEIHYDPAIRTEQSEFVEFFNSGATAVSLDGWQLAGGVQFVFAAGSGIPAEGYVVVAQNPSVLKGRFGAMALGPWTGLLSNQGETVELRASGALVDKVSCKQGFPWPTVGDPPGYSIELVNPAFDNDLGGNWRRSLRDSAGALTRVLIPQKSEWKYRKGISEPSNPRSAWRAVNFDDNTWSNGAAPIGYDPGVAMGTTLADMRGNYTSFYVRRKFDVADPSQIASLTLVS
jgi:hypothetical protein